MTLRMFATLLALLLPAAPATGGEVRVLTFSKATSDSRCIGDPVTPLCAVETLEACRIWADRKLCEAIGFDFARLGKGRADAYLRLFIFKYKIMGRKLLRVDDIPTDKRNQGERSWRPGDVVVRLWWEGCAPADRCVTESRNDPARRFGEGCKPTQCPGPGFPPQIYITRRQGGGLWRLVDDFDEPLLPEDFWKRK